MWISRYVCLFMIYSSLGWVYESIFCTVKKGKWENRGFLYGPVCPIYGVGAVLISVIFDNLDGRWAGAVQVFLIAFFGSMVLEYLTSWTLEKLFHAVWWDYKNLPLNLHGRISLFTSIGFGAAGILVVDVIAPHVEEGVDWFAPVWLELFALFFAILFSVDMTLTVSALTNFARIVERMEDSFNERMENVVETAQRKSLEARNRVAFSSMSALSRRAIRRVAAYRRPGVNMEKLRQLLEERRSG